MRTIILTVFLFLVFTIGLYISKIGEASYCILFSLTILIGFGLHGFERIKEIDFKNLKITLDEIRAAKEELFVREERLRSIIVPLTHLLAYISTTEGRLMNRNSYKAKRQWLKSKLAILMNSLELKPEEIKTISKISDIYNEIDTIFDRHDGGLKTSDPNYEVDSTRLQSLNDQLILILLEDSAT